jgi:hypothetical protein
MSGALARGRQPLADASSNANIRTILNPSTDAVAKPSAEPAQSTKPTNKRKAEPQPLEETDIDDERLENVTDSCDVVRRKIRNFINAGEMKVGEFQKEIGASSKIYGSFMNQKGPYKGSGSCVYYNAFKFFKRRELMGIKPPKKQKVSKEEEEKKLDVSGIHLEGEEEVEVPVYNTCDEIRKKINAFLREPGVTQAAFLREIAKTYPNGKKTQSKVLNDFLGKKGPSAGNTSSAFYASYVFFEKMRIRDGKPKSKFREEMEEEYAGDWPDFKPGFDVKTREKSYIVSVGTQLYEDKYGRARPAGWGR